MIDRAVEIFAQSTAMAFVTRLRAARSRFFSPFLAIRRRWLGGRARRLGRKLQPKNQLYQLSLAQAFKIWPVHATGESAIELRRKAGTPFVTDGGHNILDCAFGAIEDPEALASALEKIPGVMGHGLFLGLASAAIIAVADDLRIIGDLS